MLGTMKWQTHVYMYKRILIIMYFYPYEYRKMSHTTLSWDETSIPLISQSVLEKFEDVLKLVRFFRSNCASMYWKNVNDMGIVLSAASVWSPHICLPYSLSEIEEEILAYWQWFATGPWNSEISLKNYNFKYYNKVGMQSFIDLELISRWVTFLTFLKANLVHV